jgi:hypothetical protein
MELELFSGVQQGEECGGVVLNNSPVQETITTTTATLISCPQQQNIVLDDGYGSSNSSPHSSGTVKVYLLTVVLLHVIGRVRILSDVNSCVATLQKSIDSNVSTCDWQGPYFVRCQQLCGNFT